MGTLINKASQTIRIPSRFKVIENAMRKEKCRVIRPVLQEMMSYVRTGSGVR